MKNEEIKRFISLCPSAEDINYLDMIEEKVREFNLSLEELNLLNEELESILDEKIYILNTMEYQRHEAVSDYYKITKKLQKLNFYDKPKKEELTDLISLVLYKIASKISKSRRLKNTIEKMEDLDWMLIKYYDSYEKEKGITNNLFKVENEYSIIFYANEIVKNIIDEVENDSTREYVKI